MRHEDFGHPDTEQTLTSLTGNAADLGHELVEVSAFLTRLDAECQGQSSALGDVARQNDMLGQSADQMIKAVQRMQQDSDAALDKVRASTSFIAENGQASRIIAEWVNGIHADGETVRQMLQAIQFSNSSISDIASQVSILAVNAKIEAARAGQAGKGFSIVADSVNELSQKTADAASSVSETVTRLVEWLNGLQSGAARNANNAAQILDRATQTDQALGSIEAGVASLGRDAHALSDDAERAKQAVDGLAPVMSGMDQFVRAATDGIQVTSVRCTKLVDVSEEILQHSVALGGDGADSPMIALVQDLAGQIAQTFETALSSGRISLTQLFDATYRPIPGSDPQQVLTGFTQLTDTVLPPIQEPVLTQSSQIVFCAAVDRNGYLPTHNLKFAQPPSDDPVWNAANCRNRRIFDDRVGLKAGRNEKPFLLQVYQRDMGGGNLVMMKDLSAPIRVSGRHWGGLRLAYKF